MDEPARPPAEYVAIAAGLRTLHVRHEHERRCWWCFRPWPCPDRVWADRTLRAAREARRG